MAGRRAPRAAARSTQRRGARTAVFVVATTLAVRTNAQPRPALSDEEIAQRRLLLEQARSASDAGRHDEALVALQGAARIRSSAALQQFLAAEYESLHRYADALRAAARCIDEAVSDPSTRNRDAQTRTCRALVEQLRAQVGTLVVRVAPEAPDDLEITVDAQPLARSVWGVAYVVDPGTHTIDARSPAERVAPFIRTITVNARQTLTLDIALAPPQAPLHEPQPTNGALSSSGFVLGQPGPVALGPNPSAGGIFGSDATVCGALGQACCQGTRCNAGFRCTLGFCTPGCSERNACPTNYACREGQCLYAPPTRRFVVGASVEALVDRARENGQTGFVAGVHGAWRPLVLGSRNGWEFAGLVGVSARVGSWRDHVVSVLDGGLGVSGRLGTIAGVYGALWYTPGVAFAEGRVSPIYATYRVDFGVYVDRVTVSLRWQESGRGAYTPIDTLSLIGEFEL